MSERIHHAQCPVCNSRAINPLLTLKDYSVSGEQFVIWQCADCSLRFTQDVPDAASMQPYYQSDAYISHTDSSKGFINSTYQRIRRITLKGKAKLVKKYTGRATGSLLDVGAGTGAFFHHMQSEGWEVAGLEPDPGARANAKKIHGIELQTPAALDQLSPGSFDAITLWHVLEHVHELHATLQELKKVLKDGGRMFIAVPNYTSADAGLYRTHWAAYDVPRHLYHFSPRSMEVLLARNGLRLITKKPMWFDAFYISLLSSKYKNGKPSLPGAFLTGLRSNLKTFFSSDSCSSIIYIIGKA
jgi:SAM-dependent methyltransferase